jgi:hypothetical protein
MGKKNQIDTLITEAVQNFLSEAKSESSKISDKGAFGEGGWKREISQANTRAKTPELAKGLMKELGVTGVTGGSDIERALNVIRQSTSNSAVMKKAYPAFKIVNRKGTPTLLVDRSEELKFRDGAKYIALLLVGAESSGLLQLEKGLTFPSRALANDVITIEANK